jgi:hypothetical protein
MQSSRDTGLARTERYFSSDIDQLRKNWLLILLTIVIRMVLWVIVRAERPDSVLQTHWRLHMRSRVEGLQIATRVDDRGELLLALKEESVPI